MTDMRSLVGEFSLAANIEAAIELSQTKPEEAIGELKELERDLYDSRLEFSREDYFALRDKIQTALDPLKDVLRQKFSTDVSLNFNFGILLSRLGRDHTALEFLQRAQELSPEDAVISRKIVTSYLKLHRRDRNGGFGKNAVEEASNAVDLSPDDRSYALLGDALYENQQKEQALEAYEKLIKTQSGHDPNGYAYRRAAEITRRFVKDFDKAKEYAQKAYAQNPADRRNIEELGFAHADRNEHEQAIPYLLYAHAKKSDVRIVLIKLIGCLTETGQYDLAQEYADKLETECGDRTKSLIKKLDIFNASKKSFDEALEIAQELATDFSGSYSTAERLGRFYYAADMFEEALPFLKHTVIHDPKGQYMLNRAAHAMRKTGQTEEAGKLIELALTRRPNSLDVLLAAGWHAYDTDQMTEARHFAARIQSANPDFKPASAFLTVTDPNYRGVDWAEDLTA